MNASAFHDLWARVMFWSSQNCASRRRKTINQEMHEQVHAILCLLYSQQSYFGIKYLQHFIEFSVLILLNCLVDFPFCHLILSTFQSGLCCFQSILVFRIFYLLLNIVLVLFSNLVLAFPKQLPYCTQ